MATGMYTSPERVVRDGILVAFAGEVMTRDEAVQRGLVGRDPEPGQPSEGEPVEEPEKKPARSTRKAGK